MYQQNKFTRRVGMSVLLLLLPLLMVAAYADEGMWTFDNPPVKLLQERYGFTPTQEWLDHVRLASVRFMDGGSGAFVSSNGLVMTNHHVAVGQLQKLSTEERDLVATGFLAATPDDELKCPDLELNVLLSMENVTESVLAAVTSDMNESEALAARDAEIARIEKQSLQETGLRSDVVKLYHGGEYWLYRYQKYTDIRLVFAPERQAAYFGGDSDNFTYPRYDLDVTFFRVYEDGEPLASKHYLTWNSQGAAEDELVFVSGNPGSTHRLHTFSQLEFLRDEYYPLILNYIDQRIDALQEFSRRGSEQERRALVQIFYLENAKKALTGEHKGLHNERLMTKRRQDEADFRKKIGSNQDWFAAYGDAWSGIDAVVAKQRETVNQSFYRKLRGLPATALKLVRFVTEIEKPDEARLDGYHEAQVPAMKFKLLSPAPVYLDIEQVNLATALQLALQDLGPHDPFLKKVLDGRSPDVAAQAIIANTKLGQADFRKSLLQGGREAIEASNDPLITVIRELDPMLREWEAWRRRNIESVLASATERIAQARFAAYGKAVYPDATFTLRLSYGAVKGYPMNGTKAPSKTTLYGLYDRTLSFDQVDDFALPSRFWQRQETLDLSTPANFVSTCDIIGGNSGSPVINAKAELVGLIFDGNIESLAGRFVYDEHSNRAVAVHSAYIMEALRKLYDAGWLADEIEGVGTF